MSAIVVIGGGPAGAAAAITARQAGIEVIVLEESRFPRFRPGEALHPGLEPLLERLGARESVLKADYFRHTGMWVDWGGRNSFVPFGEDETGPWRGFQAPREDFDKRLLSLVKNWGADVRHEAATSMLFDGSGRLNGVRTAGGRVEAAFVLDASGPGHWLARQLRIPLRRKSPRLVARYGYLEGVPDFEEPLPSIRSSNAGWTWLAHLGWGRYQWTVVTEPPRRPSRSWSPPHWQGMRRCGCFGADVTWRIAARTAGRGWFLCGDAGGVLDPSSFHGVLRAMMSGMMAAHLTCAVIGGRIPEGEAENSYRQWFEDWFHHDAQIMRAAYEEAGLFGYDRRAPHSFGPLAIE